MIELRIIQFLKCFLLRLDSPTRLRRPRTIKDQGMRL